MKSRYTLPAAVSLALGILTVPSTAHAYIDPGTGSIIIQAIVAGVVGVGFFLKTNWMRVKTFFRRFTGGKKKK